MEKMEKGRIILSERDVPLGAKVHMYETGSETPVEYEEGGSVVFLALIGGVPQRKKLYPVPGGIRIGDGYGLASGFDGLHEETRFSPVEVYAPEEAPVNGRYAVFVNDEKMIHDTKRERPHQYEVAKGHDGKLVISCGFPLQMLSISGNPAFEDNEMSRYDESYTDEDLVSILRNLESSISSYEAALPRLDASLQKSISSQIDGMKTARAPVLEALGRRYRNSNIAELIRLLKSFENSYLAELPLPDDAQLVRIDRGGRQ